MTVTNAETGQSSVSADPGDGESVTVQGDKPLSDMSDVELLGLIQDATEELQKREAAEQAPAEDGAE